MSKEINFICGLVFLSNLRTTVSAVNGKHRLQDEGMDKDWVCVGLTMCSAQMCSQ